MGWKNITGNILDRVVVDDEKKEGLLNKQKEIDNFLLDCRYKIKSLAESYPGSAYVGHAIAIPFRS